MKRLGLGGFLCMFTLTLLFSVTTSWHRPSNAQSAPPSPWLTQAAPVLETYPGESPFERANYNLDCLPERGTSRHDGGPSLPAITFQGCATYTPYGKFNAGYLQIKNTSLYGLLFDDVVPIPNNTTVFRRHQGTAYVGSGYLLPDYPNRLELTRYTDGQILYSLRAVQPVFLRDSAGDLLNIDYASISFSANGGWMVAIANERLLRVNLETYEVTLFDEPQYLGDNIQIQLAISDDGRLVALASSVFRHFKVYDLQTCPPTPAVCPSINLLDYLPPPAVNGTDYVNLRFGPESLSFYRRDQVGLDVTWQRMVIITAAGRAARLTYLALGDSFASGDGAYDYQQGTDTSTNHCRLSAHAYPNLIWQELGLQPAESLACSGSIISQVARSATKTSAVLTVSVGGNDIGFGKRLIRCIEADTCYSSYEDRLELVRQINNLFNPLVKLYHDLRQSAPPGGKVYVIGYPDLIKTNGDCGLNVRLSAAEIDFANLAVNYLNGVIQQAALKAGVLYVDTTGSLDGHRLCEASSQLAVNGITVGNDIIDWGLVSGPFGSESFHPNQLGHRLLKDSILSLTGRLNQAMQQPDFSVGPPNEDPSLAILQAPKSGRTVYSVNYDEDLTNDIIVRDGWWNVVVEVGKVLLKPLSTVRAVLTSEPVELGSLEVDEQGGLTGSVYIPSAISPGSHTLHIYGESILGEPIDIQKVVYVAASADDIDGDGLLNSFDTCLTINGNDASPICAGAATRPPTRILASSSSTRHSDKSQPGPALKGVVLGQSISRTAQSRKIEKPTVQFGWWVAGLAIIGPLVVLGRRGGRGLRPRIRSPDLPR